MEKGDNEIEIILKPVGISEIHKREVKINVPYDQKVFDFARTLLNIMQLRDKSPNLVNLLFNGKVLQLDQTFSSQGVQDGSKLIFTLKKGALPAQPITKKTDPPQKAPQPVAQPVTKPVATPITKPPSNPIPKQESVAQGRVEIIGRQSDGTFRSLMETQEIEDLNPQSISILMSMGFVHADVVKALRYLKDQKNYNPVGEVQKAIDYLNEINYKQQERQVMQLSLAELRREQMEMAAAMSASLPKQQMNAKPEQKPMMQEGVKLKLKAAQVSNVFAWGNGFQGQLGQPEFQKYQPRPIVVQAFANIKIQKISCGANHTVALTKFGEVYFWGQYVHPLKKAEKPRYGRLVSPKLQESLLRENKFIVDIQTGSSHSLALSLDGVVYSWGEGLYGQLGNNENQNVIEPSRVHINESIKVTKISAGVGHSCAITQNGLLLLWGLNSACQLGYSKQMKMSLYPILFGGKIHLREKEKEEEEQPVLQMHNSLRQEEEYKDEEMKNSQQSFTQENDKKKLIYDVGIQYLDIVSGGGQSLAVIQQPPYLLVWGNGNPNAESFSQTFALDRPVKYSCGSTFTLIQTEKGIIYKVNLENQKIEKVFEEGSIEEETLQEVKDFQCGSDFQLFLMQDRNIYGLGQNQSGQLGLGHFQAAKQLQSITGLLNESIEAIFTGNQHSFCVTSQNGPLEIYIKEFNAANNRGQVEKSMLQIQVQGKPIYVHTIILQTYNLNAMSFQTISYEACYILFEMLYQILDSNFLPNWLQSKQSTFQSISAQIEEVQSWIKANLKDTVVLQKHQIVLNQISKIVQQMSWAQDIKDHLTEEEQEGLKQMYIERNTIISELITINNQLRQRALNENAPIPAFTSFTYYKGINFNDERLQASMPSQSQQSRMEVDQYGEEYGNEDEDDY